MYFKFSLNTYIHEETVEIFPNFSSNDFSGD